MLQKSNGDVASSFRDLRDSGARASWCPSRRDMRTRFRTQELPTQKCLWNIYRSQAMLHGRSQIPFVSAQKVVEVYFLLETCRYDNAKQGILCSMVLMYSSSVLTRLEIMEHFLWSMQIRKGVDCSSCLWRIAQHEGYARYDFCLYCIDIFANCHS